MNKAGGLSIDKLPPRFKAFPTPLPAALKVSCATRFLLKGLGGGVPSERVHRKMYRLPSSFIVRRFRRRLPPFFHPSSESIFRSAAFIKALSLSPPAYQG